MNSTADSHVRGLPLAAGTSAGATTLGAQSPPLNRGWLVNSWSDLFLFVGTPVLIIPLVSAAQFGFSIEAIGLFVGAFGALGHNLPGMMRAYGDRELFRRFRVRFVLAPLFLLLVCETFSLRGLRALDVILLLWGFWHAAMQVYGFARIYDAKVGSISAITARLDWYMCVAWFGAGVVCSDWRLGELLWTFYRSGGPLLPSSAALGFQSAWMLGTAAITTAFLVNLAWQSFRGRPPSVVKLLLMASGFGFWWYAVVVNKNIVLGVAMWEVFHDVQYLAIVWIYNRKRVETGRSVGAFTRFLFRRSGAMIGLYTGLVFAYGYMAFLEKMVDTHTLNRLLHGFIAASAMLHFYFDGFIWKVSERVTREGLGLRGGRAENVASWGLPPGLVHGMKWAWFAVPVFSLGWSESWGPDPTLEQCRTIVAVAPKYCRGQLTLGVALASQGVIDEAIGHFQQALRLDPAENDHAYAHHNLGLAHSRQGKLNQAIERFRQAIELKPDLVEAHYSLGRCLHAQGKFDEAIDHYRRVVELHPDSPDDAYTLMERARQGLRTEPP